MSSEDLRKQQEEEQNEPPTVSIPSPRRRWGPRIQVDPAAATGEEMTTFLTTAGTPQQHSAKNSNNNGSLNPPVEVPSVAPVPGGMTSGNPEVSTTNQHNPKPIPNAAIPPPSMPPPPPSQPHQEQQPNLAQNSGSSQSEVPESRKRHSPTPTPGVASTSSSVVHPSSTEPGAHIPPESYTNDFRLLEEVEWGPREDDSDYDSDQTLAPRPKNRITDETCDCHEPPPGQLWTCRTDDCINYACREECRKNNCVEQCGNQRISRKEFKNVEVFDAGVKGYGLRVLEDCVKGDIICEYTGQAVRANALSRLFRRYQHERRLYIMALDEKVYIDAKRAGGLARFINHSCNPNCKVERWRVKGVFRAAVIAERSIKAGSELTFDYKWDRKIGRAPTKCHCGEPDCRGTLEVSKSIEEVHADQFLSGNWVSPKHRRADERIVNRTIRIQKHKQHQRNSPVDNSPDKPYYLVGEITEFNPAAKLHKILYHDLTEEWVDLRSGITWLLLDEGEESPTRAGAIARKVEAITDSTKAGGQSLLTAFTAVQTPCVDQQFFYLYIQTPIKEAMFNPGNSMKERLERSNNVSLTYKQMARPPLPCNPEDPEDLAKFDALAQSFDGTVWKVSIAGKDKDVAKTHEHLQKSVQYWQKKLSEDQHNPVTTRGTATINGSGGTEFNKLIDEVIFPRVVADLVKRKLPSLRERCRGVSIHVKPSESKSKHIARLVLEANQDADLQHARTQIRNAIMAVCLQEMPAIGGDPLPLVTVQGEKIPRDFGFLGGSLEREEFEALVHSSSRLLNPTTLKRAAGSGGVDPAATILLSKHKGSSWASIDLNDSPFFTSFEALYGPVWVQSEDDMGRISKYQLVGDAKSTNQRKVYFGCDPKDIGARWEVIRKRAQELVRGIRFLFLGTDLIYQRFMNQNQYFAFIEAITGTSIELDSVTGNHIRIDGASKGEAVEQFLPDRVKVMTGTERADLAEELIRLQIEVYRDQFTRKHCWIFGRDWGTIIVGNEEPVPDNIKQLAASFGQLDNRSAPHCCVEIAEVVAHLDLSSTVAAHAAIILYRFVSTVPDTQMKARDAVLACIFIANKAQKTKRWRRLELVLEAGYKAFYPGTQFDPEKEEVIKLEQRVLAAEQELLGSLQYDVFVRDMDCLDQAISQSTGFIETVYTFAFGGQVLGAGAQLWLKYGIDYVFAASAAYLKADLKEIVCTLKLIPLKVSQTAKLIYDNARYGKPNSDVVPSHPLLEGDKTRLEKYIPRIHETCVRFTKELTIPGSKPHIPSPTRQRCVELGKANLRSYTIRGVHQQTVADYVLQHVEGIEAESGCSIFLSPSPAPAQGRDDITIQGPWRAVAIADYLLRLPEELSNLPAAEDVPDGTDTSIQQLEVKASAGLVDAHDICTSVGWNGTIHPLGSKDHADRQLGGKCCLAGKISVSALRKSGLRWWIGHAKGSSPEGAFTEMFSIRRGGDKLKSLAQVTLSMEDPEAFPKLSSFGDSKLKRDPEEKSGELDEEPHVPISVQRWPSEKVSLKEVKKRRKSNGRVMGIGFSPGALQEMQLLTILHKLVPSPHGHPNFILPVGIAVPEEEEENAKGSPAQDGDDPMFSLFKTTQENETAAMKEKNVKTSPHLVFQPSPFVLQRFMSRKQSDADILEAPIVLTAWFYDLISALVHCHDNHIILRNLQADQIIVDHSGVAKLSNLYRSNVLALEDRRHPPTTMSLVKELKKKGGSKKKDEEEDTAITPYHPPEILLGSPKHTKESDVWTMGSLLAHILLGKPPFGGKDRQSLLTSMYKIVGVPSPENFEDAARFPHYTKAPKKYKRGVEKAFAHMLKSEHAPKYTKAIDLLARMLHLDPSQRCTAKEALNHEFLTEFSQNIAKSSYREAYVREWMSLKEKLVKSSGYSNGGASRPQQLRALSMLATAKGGDSNDEGGDGLYDFEV